MIPASGTSKFKSSALGQIRCSRSPLLNGSELTEYHRIPRLFVYLPAGTIPVALRMVICECTSNGYLYMNCLIHAISFSFEMCLANEVKLESLTKKNHGQVRRDGVLFLIAVTTIKCFSASKYGLRRKRLPSGRLCTLEKSVLAFSLYTCLLFLFLGRECSLLFQVQERKNRS